MDIQLTGHPGHPELDIPFGTSGTSSSLDIRADIRDIPSGFSKYPKTRKSGIFRFAAFWSSIAPKSPMFAENRLKYPVPYGFDLNSSAPPGTVCDNGVQCFSISPAIATRRGHVISDFTLGPL